MGKIKEKVKNGAKKVGKFVGNHWFEGAILTIVGMVAYQSVKDGKEIKESFNKTMEAEQSRIEDLHSHQEETYTRLIEALSGEPDGLLRGENSDITEF